MTEGARLALYRYDTFRSARPLPPPVEVRVTGSTEALAEALAGAEGTCLARDLVNSPPGVLTPASFAHRIEAAAAEAGLSCEVYEGPTLARLRLAGLAAVSRGSAKPAWYVELVHEPAQSPAHTVALVGKGVTCDSGGLSLKPSDELHTMSDGELDQGRANAGPSRA